MDTFLFGSDGNDQFWGAAYNQGQALFVGYKGGGPPAGQTEVENDDAYALLLPIIIPEAIFLDGFEAP